MNLPTNTIILDAITACVNLTATVLSIKQNKYTWPLSLLGCCISIMLYLNVNLKFNISKEIIELFCLSYGWYSWHTIKTKNSKAIHILPYSTFFLTLFILIISSLLLGCFLSQYSSINNPLLDAITSILTFYGLILMANKSLQCWLIWLIVDTSYIFLFYRTMLPFNLIKACIYVCLCLYGYITWKKQLIQDANKSNNYKLKLANQS